MLVLTTPRTEATSPYKRGRWCNHCGVRLAPEPASAWHASAPAGRRVVWAGAGGQRIAWSLCEHCCAEKMLCSLCRYPAGHDAVLHDGVEQVYCRRCYEGAVRCDVCGRPSPHAPYTWNGQAVERTLCDLCLLTSTVDPASAHRLYRWVRISLARTLALTLDEPCRLQMAPRHRMLHLIEKSALRHLDAGSRGRCFGLFLREGRRCAIIVEHGLPRMVMLEVLAHEYAHAWQSERCRADLPLEVQEGFAEWAAYTLVQEWGCTRRAERMLRRDDVYGEGLRLVLEWEREGGTAEVLRRVRG